MTQKRFIYADNAATTRMSKAAYETMRQYLLEEYGNASQPYSFSRSARNAIKDARTRIAECIGASPSEIYFTSGGTESDNWVIKGGWLQGRSIFTSKIEHHAVLKSCDLVNERGGQVTYVDVDGSGVIDMQHLENSLSQGALLSVMAANNEIGTIEPIADCAQIAHKKGALFHTDAVQAVGHLPIDVHKTGIDFLSASAHKFNGPKGIGFLYMKDGLVLASLISGGSQEKGLRAGTENVASIVAMAVALEENLRCLKENQEKLRIIEESIIGKLNACGVDYIRNGSSNHLPGLLSLSFPHVSGETILHRMDLMGISISTGSACDGRSNIISHVIEAVKVDDKYAAGTIRISLGKENNISDANMIAEGIIKIISGYGKD